jgi:hypothetical protein
VKDHVSIWKFERDEPEMGMQTTDEIKYIFAQKTYELLKASEGWSWDDSMISMTFEPGWLI